MLSINSDEIVGLIAAFLTTISFLPQAIKVYRHKATDGLSLTMYLIMFFGVCMWLYYGIRIQSLSVIVANTVTAAMQIFIIFNILKKQR
ncbi:MAG: SemiSWEET transporter [Flavobacteriaceae bacterium]|jgi:MtN3 and saliva related transmembrane protein